ncbi:MAG TPA: glycosyltransferase, partial [Bacteroidia bacterium]
MILATTILVLVSIYFLWLLVLAVAWISDSGQTTGDSNQLPVSIIIPCRNEANNILHCLESIYNQSYPKQLIEIIVVDDHSDDITAQLVSEEGGSIVTKLPMGTSGKKAAITYGVNMASYELIITRDADTVCGKNWLQALVNEFKKEQPDMLIAPVTLKMEGTFINLFERLEYYAFTIITGGTAILKKPILCNGANLLFKKSTFLKVNGYAGNEKTASGDDVFLLNKIAALPGSMIRYLKNYEGTVFTNSATTINDFIQQRLRWAGKNTSNTNLWSAFTGLLVFF